MTSHYTREHIQSLLTSFMAGTTTLEEEDVLSRYFHQANVPEEWRDYQLLFKEMEALPPACSPASGVKARRLPLRRRLRWAAAAAVALGVAGTATQWLPMSLPQEGQTAETALSPADTAAVALPASAARESPPDSTVLQQRQPTPSTPDRHSLRRKSEPTIHDYDRAYVRLARMQQEHRQVELQIEQARLDILQARLTAAGYVGVQTEDGSIIYVEEPQTYFTYEE